MRLKRRNTLMAAGALVVAAALAAMVGAEVLGSQSVSVTQTTQTVQASRPAWSLTLINDSASANELYARVFCCGEPTGAAVAADSSTPIRLQPGESVGFKYNREQAECAQFGAGYCAFSVVCAAGETATLRWVGK
jgi:hypothetical protein